MARSSSTRGRPITARSFSGDIALAYSAPKAEISATNRVGPIYLKNIRGTIHAETASGGINVSGSTLLKHSRLASSAGDIHLSDIVSVRGQATIRAPGGRVTLSVTPLEDMRISVTTTQRDMAANFGPEPRPRDGQPGSTWHYGSAAAPGQLEIRAADAIIRQRHHRR